MSDIYKTVSSSNRVIGHDQTDKISDNQVMNNAGGYVYQLSTSDRLKRFLVLGSDSSTYYQSATDMTIESTKFLVEAFNDPSKGKECVDILMDYRYKVPRRQSLIYAYVISTSSNVPEVSSYSLSKFSSIIKTGTDLFTFLSYIGNFRGFGRSLKRSVASLYNDKSLDQLGYQVAKYRNREGWTHRDVLRVSHPKSSTHNDLYKWIVSGNTNGDLPEVVLTLIKAQSFSGEGDLSKVVDLINSSKSISWEFLPTEYLTYPDVWKSLLYSGNLPYTAMIRNISRFRKLGLFSDIEFISKLSTTIIDNAKSSKIHPLQVLTALYMIDKDDDPSLPTSIKVNSALDSAFYSSFDNVSPSGSRIFQAFDVSGSMTNNNIMKSPFNAMEASMALGTIFTRTEPTVYNYAFSSYGTGNISRAYSGVVEFPIGVDEYLPDIISRANEYGNYLFTRTDCSLPMMYALDHRIEVDAFIIYTDNETYSGSIHPVEALKAYRDRMGINAKLIVVGMTSTGFSIADPEDNNSLDVVGFDTGLHKVVTDFISL